MRKFLLFSILLTALFSCTQKYDLEQTHETKSDCQTQIQVTANLKAFNDSIISQNYEETRGGGRLWGTATADVLAVIPSFKTCVGIAGFITAVSGGTAGVGAGIGVLAGTAFLSGGVSYTTYKSLKGCHYSMSTDEYMQITQNNNKNQLLIIDSEKKIQDSDISITDNNELDILNDSVYDLIGTLHNGILENVINATKLTRGSINENIEDIYQGDFPYYINSYGIASFNDEDMLNMSNKISQDMESYWTVKDYSLSLDEFSNKGYITYNTSTILKLFFDLFTGYVKDKETMEETVCYYENEIRSTQDLDKEEKQIILMSLSVARHSFNYWYDKDVKE